MKQVFNEELYSALRRQEPLESLDLKGIKKCRFSMAALMNHPEVRIEILLAGVKNEDEGIALSALSGIARLMRAGTVEYDFRHKYACILDTLAERSLRQEQAWGLRMSLAELLYPTSPHLMSLCLKNEFGVHMALVQRPDCPKAILEYLAKLPEEESGSIKDKNKEARNAAIARVGEPEKEPTPVMGTVS